MGLGQYDGLEQYCGPHTAFSVFVILISLFINAANQTNFNILCISGKILNNMKKRPTERSEVLTTKLEKGAMMFPRRPPTEAMPIPIFLK